MSRIVPAILAKDTEDLKEKLLKLPKKISYTHIDVLEDDIWAGPPSTNFEAHLMVKDPGGIVGRWIKRGAKSIVVHKIDNNIKSLKGQVMIGLGIEMSIDLESIKENISNIDFIHLMSIDEIGEQGHLLDERIFDRIKEVKRKYPSLPVSVDGGININNYKKLEAVGADALVVGSGFEELWNSLTEKSLN